MRLIFENLTPTADLSALLEYLLNRWGSGQTWDRLQQLGTIAWADQTGYAHLLRLRLLRLRLC